MASPSRTPQIDASASYLNFEFTQINDNAAITIPGVSLDTKEPYAPDHQFNVGTVAVTNFTDHFYYINKVFGAAPTNVTEGQPGAPREWLVTVKRNF